MALSWTYDLLAGQEPFRGVIALRGNAGKMAGRLEEHRSAVVTFPKRKGLALDEARGAALNEFGDEKRLTELFGDLADAAGPMEMLAALDGTIINAAAGDTLGDTGELRP